MGIGAKMGVAVLLAAGWSFAAAGAETPPAQWKHLSSASGDLPVPPGGSMQQTASLVGDFDGDGVNDFVLGFRQKAPALVWYRRTDTGWKTYVIEKELLTIEAGGAAYDIDGDGDLDLVFGGDWQSNQVWWWENPSPSFDPAVSWKRHVIKKDGKTQHHDQAFGDYMGAGREQLAFWNQGARTIFMAPIPSDPRTADGWKLSAIYTGSGGEESRQTFRYPEGMSAYDIDADGNADLLAGNTWFKSTGDGKFKATRIADVGGLIFAGYFKPTKYPQVVISPGDGVGRVRWYECTGDPQKSKDWVGHDLLDRDVIHGHSLQLGDVDGDGHLDIFLAEMGKWREAEKKPDNPDATAWIFYGDGQGHFRKTELVKGMGWHESRLADLDGDGDLDLLEKPYNWEVPRVDVWLNGGTRTGARGVGTSASFHGPVGLQLYSLRDIAGKNVPLALQWAHNFGFVEVEVGGNNYGHSTPQFLEMLHRHGLKAVSTMYDYGEWEKDPEGCARRAKELGVKFAGCAWIPHQGMFDEATALKAAAVFNRAGEAADKLGIRFFYHNHGYEFVKHGDGTLFDLLMSRTDPKKVSYEMDVFWTVHPGQDPVKLLGRYPDRWVLMHIKDLKKGVATGKLTGSEDINNDVALGTGQIDLPAVLREAQRIGIKHYFIEDESPISTQQIPKSLKYLESLSW